MAKDLHALRPTLHVATVQKHGEKIIIPQNMEVDDAIQTLSRFQEEQQQEVEVSDTFDVLPQDGAFGLARVIADLFGWTQSLPTPGFFGDNPPEMIKVQVSPSERVEIPWGRLALPGVSGYLQTGVSRSRTGRAQFSLHALVKRKDQGVVEKLFAKLHEYLRENSIYRGKAIKMRFRDEDGDLLAMPTPEFIDVSRIDETKLVYSEDVMTAVQANLFTPIQRIQDCLDNDIKIKRGVLLGGMYGTGKTLAASVASKLAVQNGVTYVYTPHASELGDAIEFAKQYQSSGCVVFCEDIDREVTGDRSVKMDDILNILDGIDTKGANIITVLTTNHLENINKAMLRPGRLDAIINVTPPDAKAVEKLVRLYGGASIAESEDLTSVGQVLDGQIPAIVEEVVKRAKLFQLNITPKGEKIVGITAEALEAAAKTMKTQMDLLADPVEEKPDALATAFGAVVRDTLNGTKEKVSQIHKRVC